MVGANSIDLPFGSDIGGVSDLTLWFLAIKDVTRLVALTHEYSLVRDRLHLISISLGSARSSSDQANTLYHERHVPRIFSSPLEPRRMRATA